KTTQPCPGKPPTCCTTWSCCCAPAAWPWATRWRSWPPASEARLSPAARPSDNRPMRTAWLLLSIPLCAPALAQVRGVVFDDANANGIREAGEQGLAGIKVSNGRAIVSTGPDGGYGIATQAGDIVFAIKPADRRFGLRADGLPASWQAAGEGERFDIALSPAHDATDTLEVLLFTDPQVASLVDVDDYHKI